MLLEDGANLVECTGDIAVCERANICPTRLLWKEVSEAMFARLQATTLADLVKKANTMEDMESKT